MAGAQEVRVEVGMPAHERHEWIAEAVSSVQAQTFEAWRLTILDDGEEGNPVHQAVRPFLDDPRVQYVATGVPVSANQAQTDVMQRATAPLFAFLHDDDCWGPRFLERRVRFLDENPGCQLVFSGHTDLDPQGRKGEVHEAGLPPGPVDPGVLLPRFNRYNAIDTMHSVVVRRDALEQVGAHVAPDFPRLYDWELWLRVAARFPVGYVEGAEDVFYRVYDEQMSSRPGQGKDFLAMFDHADAVIAAAAPEHRLPAQERRALRAQRLLSVALDDVMEGRRREALSVLRRVGRERPAALAGSRALIAGAGVVLGPLAQGPIRRARTRAHR